MDDMFEKGLAKRKATLGADYVDNTMAKADQLNRPFQEAMTAWCWGFGWGDDAIDEKTRSMMKLAMIGALGKMTDGVHVTAPSKRLQPGRNPGDCACHRYLLRCAAGSGMSAGRPQGSG